jgi:hypothetical protein
MPSQTRTNPQKTAIPAVIPLRLVDGARSAELEADRAALPGAGRALVNLDRPAARAAPESFRAAPLCLPPDQVGQAHGASRCGISARYFIRKRRISAGLSASRHGWLQLQPICNRPVTHFPFNFMRLCKWLQSCRVSSCHAHVCRHMRAHTCVIREARLQLCNRRDKPLIYMRKPVANRLRIGCGCNRFPEPIATRPLAIPSFC